MKKEAFSLEEKQNMTLELMIKVVSILRMLMKVTSLKKLIMKEEVLLLLVYVPG